MPEMIREAKKKAIKLSDNAFSLKNDVFNGWAPRSDMKNPFPLLMTDDLTFHLEKMKDWVYKGFTPTNSYELHAGLSGEYSYSVADPDLKLYKQLLDKQLLPKQPRILPKSNPSKFEPQVEFDSFFESGNLAFSFRPSQREFILFLRIDTNTKGHTQWFHFGVRSEGDMIANFTIMNMSKCNSIFAHGGKPVWSRGNDSWNTVENVWYSEISSAERAKWFPSENYRKVSSLRFSFSLKKHEKVFFAYTIPYTYGYLQKRLKVYKEYCKVETLCNSGSGLDVPLLKFPCKKGNSSPIVFVTARIHPGEACSSHIAEGLIDHLCTNSDDPSFLLNHAEVRIIPMINVDGVVCGNFRTGLSGDDLNRRYLKTNPLLHPVVRAVKTQISEIQHREGRTILAFLDLHGHSTKPNLFTYGPDIDASSRYFMASRYYIKRLSEHLPFFNPKNCSWQVPSSKKSTARWVMLHNFGIELVYTVEASTASITSKEGKVSHFTSGDYRLAGKHLLTGLEDVLLLQNGSIKISIAELSEVMNDAQEEGKSDSEEEDDDFQGQEKRKIHKKIEKLIMGEKKTNTVLKKKQLLRSNMKIRPKATDFTQLGRMGRSEEVKESRDLRRNHPLISLSKRKAAFMSSSATPSKVFDSSQSRTEKPRDYNVAYHDKAMLKPVTQNSKNTLKELSRFAVLNQAIMSRMVKRKEQKCEILRHHEPTENHRSQPLTTEFTKHLYENYLPQVPKVPSSKKLDETESKKPKQIPSEEIKLKKLRSEEPSLERRGYYPSSNSMDPEKNVLLSQIAFRFPKGGLQQASPDLPVVSKKVINGSDFMKQIQEGKKPRRPQNLPSLYKALPWTIRDKWAFRTKE